MQNVHFLVAAFRLAIYKMESLPRPSSFKLQGSDGRWIWNTAVTVAYLRTMQFSTHRLRYMMVQIESSFPLDHHHHPVELSFSLIASSHFFVDYSITKYHDVSNLASASC
jgi:hypothetical protein